MTLTRTMGLDLGKKNIGIAMSDLLGMTAQPCKVLHRTSLKEDLNKLVLLCRENSVSEIVLGYPINMNGTIGTAANEARKFKDKLSEATGIPVYLWDERLSTSHANKILLEGDMRRNKRKKVKDIMAAIIILESFLISRNQKKD